MIYIAHGFAIEQLAAPLQPWLSASERERAQGYASQARQLQYQLGRSLLRWLVCSVTGVDASAVTIERHSSGAPLLTIAASEVACSISHKADAVMVAFGDADALGIDVETMKRRKRHAELIDEFSDGFMNGVEVRDLTTFYQRWTLAESVTKARQGKLLATLREPFMDYANRAIFHTELEHMFCCYAAQRQTTATKGFQWWQVTTTDRHLLTQQLVFETN
ncbi:4'-phosphopantetheinyl transferase family protein [Pseudidiomarina homiensis]|uniref:Uncharacterized protein n=1 Tax=Pseudidiomarina homiensis TaxID=364198 RepID=A0A432XY54_9GAMM|nr:4'-phosphopantetheinyl transferase superfamily protein [Pseudidiomarina homiensis]RUO53646.1 hypothetical protein CWI70_10745 [Pseudidiomarina homiensis]